MAGRGPAPKDPATRRRRNADPIATTYVAADGQARGPELPDGFEWPAMTRAWWETWRKSPQATTFTESDWSYLLDTALLHAELWRGKTDVAAEVRLRVAKFGATPEDRARLRMQVTPTSGEQKPAAPAKPAGRYGHLRVASNE